MTLPCMYIFQYDLDMKKNCMNYNEYDHCNDMQLRLSRSRNAYNYYCISFFNILFENIQIKAIK